MMKTTFFKKARPDPELAAGEVRLYSAGGAEILLKNNGQVQINGHTFDWEEEA